MRGAPVGGKYVEVRASESVFIDAATLAMAQEAIRAAKRVLEREEGARARSAEDREEAMEARARAEAQSGLRCEERDRLLRALLERHKEIEAVEERVEALVAAVNAAREKRDSLDMAAKRTAEQRLAVEALEGRGGELDQEIVRAQNVLRTMRSARIKLQAQLQADTQQATRMLRQREERLSNGMSEDASAIRAERDEQKHLRDKLKRLELALSKADEDVAALLKKRRAKMEQMHDRLSKVDDSPLKAEYRRASQRLQKEREEADVLKLQYNILVDERESHEKKLVQLQEGRRIWAEEKRRLVSQTTTAAGGDGAGRHGGDAAGPKGKGKIARELFPTAKQR